MVRRRWLVDLLPRAPQLVVFRDRRLVPSDVHLAVYEKYGGVGWKCFLIVQVLIERDMDCKSEAGEHDKKARVIPGGVTLGIPNTSTRQTASLSLSLSLSFCLSLLCSLVYVRHLRQGVVCFYEPRES